MTVYADVLFLINFAFDAQLLFVLCKIYSKKAPVFKILLSAALGGLAGVFVFVPYFGILLWPPAKVVLPVLMTAAVFLPCRKKMLASASATFAGMSFMFSGAVNFFGLSAASGLMVPALVYVIVCIIKKNIKKNRSRTILWYKGKKTMEEGFLDSGNMLSSNGAPVILGNRAVFERLLGKGFSPLAISEWADSCDVRIVPYTALGKRGAIIGIKLDWAEIDGKRYPGAVLAYSEEEFSEDLILNSAMT